MDFVNVSLTVAAAIAYLITGVLVSFKAMKHFTAYLDKLSLYDWFMGVVMIIFWLIPVSYKPELFVPTFYRFYKNFGEFKNPFYKGN